jgi:thioredoxin 1
MPLPLSDSSLDSDWTVVALCAEWCGTCRDYRQAFEARAARRNDAHHVWIDIEDEADWLGELDVETFPTLLVLHALRPRFFGPVLPQVDVIDHTLRALRDSGPAGDRPDPIPAEHRAAVERLIEHLRRVTRQ